MPLKQGVKISDNPQYAVVTNSERHGYGVYSWHIKKKDADNNALTVRGVVVPVDYYHGQVILPYLARRVAEGFLKGNI